MPTVLGEALGQLRNDMWNQSGDGLDLKELKQVLEKWHAETEVLGRVKDTIQLVCKISPTTALPYQREDRATHFLKFLFSLYPTKYSKDRRERTDKIKKLGLVSILLIGLSWTLAEFKALPVAQLDVLAEGTRIKVMAQRLDMERHLLNRELISRIVANFLDEDPEPPTRHTVLKIVDINLPNYDEIGLPLMIKTTKMPESSPQEQEGFTQLQKLSGSSSYLRVDAVEYLSQNLEHIIGQITLTKPINSEKHPSICINISLKLLESMRDKHYLQDI